MSEGPFQNVLVDKLWPARWNNNVELCNIITYKANTQNYDLGWTAGLSDAVPKFLTWSLAPSSMIRRRPLLNKPIVLMMGVAQRSLRLWKDSAQRVSGMQFCQCICLKNNSCVLLWLCYFITCCRSQLVRPTVHWAALRLCVADLRTRNWCTECTFSYSMTIGIMIKGDFAKILN